MASLRCQLAVMVAFMAAGAAMAYRAPAPGYQRCGSSSSYLKVEGTSCVTECSDAGCTSSCKGRECRPLLEYKQVGD
jgi:hypothetical protein